MPSARPLAFISRSESLPSLPADTAILPVDPSVAVPRRRTVRARPEALLKEADAEKIEEAVETIVRTWWQAPSHRDAFVWRGVNLAECLAYGIWFTARDLVKAAWVLDRLLEQEHPSEFWTDIPQLDASPPPYPYLSTLGSMVQALAKSLAVPYHNLAVAQPSHGRPLRTMAAKAYGILASRSALSRLRQGRSVILVGPHREFYLPLAKALRSKGPMGIAMCPSSSLIRASPRDGLFVLPLESLPRRGERREVRAFRDTTLRALRDMELQGPLEQGRSDLAPLLRTYLGPRLAREIEDLASLGLGFEGDLKQGRHVIVVETESPLSKATLRYAHRARVPVTVLQHGVLDSEAIYGRLEGTRIAAWGPADAEWFRTHLKPDVRAVPTGSPRYDALADGTPFSPSSLRLPSLSVLFASQPFVPDRALRSPWEVFRALSMVVESAARSSNWTLLVKWHPSQVPWELPLEGGPPAVPILQFHRENTWELIRGSRVVVTLASTVALEAMYMGCPVVFLGPRDPSSGFPPPGLQNGLRASTSEELDDYLNRLLNDHTYRERVLEDQRGFLETHFAPLDGQASERVVQFITQA